MLGADAPPAPDAPLLDAGVDSLGAVELRGALQSAVGAGLPGPLPATLLFDHATTGAIARYVHERLVEQARAQGAAEAGASSAKEPPPPLPLPLAPRPPPASPSSSPLVEVCAVASRMPGGGRSALRLAAAAEDAVSRIPLERWRVPGEFGGGGGGGGGGSGGGGDDDSGGGSSAVRFGAFLPPGDAERFDARAFGLGASEAALVDPQQRLVLELSAEVWSRAGLLLRAPPSPSAGVHVGASAVDFDRLSRALRLPLLPHSATGSLSPSVIPGRVAFALGLQGPAVAYDTACSSSLVALRAAAEELMTMTTTTPTPPGAAAAPPAPPSPVSAALVAGVNVQLVSSTPETFLRAGMLSPEGRCKALDAAADGYVRAEAVNVLALRRRTDVGGTRDAETAPPPAALAVLAGAATGNDGRSASLTAPSGVAQQRVLRDALSRARAAPRDVALLSLHGTGTPLGDPIECGAIGAVFCAPAPPPSAGARARPPLALAASKARYGHSEPGAGLVAVVAALAAAAQGRLDPVPHLRALNPLVPEGLLGCGGRVGVGVGVPRQAAGAPSDGGGGGGNGGLLFGCSAFAFQGTNAHVLLRTVPEVLQQARQQPGTAASSFCAAATADRARLWPLPPASALVLRFSAAGGGDASVARFEGPPLCSDGGAAAALTHLRDHVVRGRALVPAAAFAELAGAAARTLWFAGAPSSSSSSSSSSSFSLALSAGSIPAPLVLPPPGSDGGISEVTVGCDVWVESGRVEVWSRRRRRDGRGASSTGAATTTTTATHLQARAACVTAQPARAAPFRPALLLLGVLGRSAASALGPAPPPPAAAAARVAPCPALAGRAPRALAHPAELDAAFQLGALREVAAGGRSRGSRTAVPLRVPTGFALIVTGEEQEDERQAGAWAWAGRCGDGGDSGGGSLAVDYGLSFGGAGASGVRIDALEARPMVAGGQAGVVGASDVARPAPERTASSAAPGPPALLTLYEAVPLVAGAEDDDDDDEEEYDDDDDDDDGDDDGDYEEDEVAPAGVHVAVATANKRRGGGGGGGGGGGALLLALLQARAAAAAQRRG